MFLKKKQKKINDLFITLSELTINSMINDIQAKNNINSTKETNTAATTITNREEMTRYLKDFSEKFQYIPHKTDTNNKPKKAQSPKRKQTEAQGGGDEYDGDNYTTQTAKKSKLDKSTTNQTPPAKKTSTNSCNEDKTIIRYKSVNQIKVVRITKSYIIKELLDKQGKMISSEIIKPKETKETVSDNKSVKLIKTVPSSTSSNLSLSDPKNDDVFTDGEVDDDDGEAQAQFSSSHFEFNGVRKSISNSSLNSINSEDKNNMSTSTSINSIVNESAKTRKKSETAKEKPGAKAKNKIKPKATKAAKQKESEKPKTSSKSLARPGPASKKQQLLLEPAEAKVEKNKILIKRTRKPRNYLVANRYSTKVENSDEENDSIRETSEPDEAQEETRSRAKTRKNSSNARQREASSKRAPPARSRSPPKTFSHLRFKVTSKERNEDLISLKKSEADYLLVISDSMGKKALPRLSIQPASKEASFNSASAKSSIKITSTAEPKEAGAIAPAEPNEFSMDCNALAWVIILIKMKGVFKQTYYLINYPFDFNIHLKLLILSFFILEKFLIFI